MECKSRIHALAAVLLNAFATIVRGILAKVKPGPVGGLSAQILGGVVGKETKRHGFRRKQVQPAALVCRRLNGNNRAQRGYFAGAVELAAGAVELAAGAAAAPGISGFAGAEGSSRGMSMMVDSLLVFAEVSML